MVKRIVKMVFREESVPEFVQLFQEIKTYISNFAGCTYLELWQDKTRPNTFFTYSYWEDEKYLENYRNSDFFQIIWPKTKALFEEKAQAWTIDVVNVSEKLHIKYLNVSDQLHEYLAATAYSEFVVLCDENTRHFCLPIIAEAFGETPYHIIEIASGETNKNINIVQKIWKTLFDLRMNRKSLVVNLGGGVVGDMGGFSAGTFMRGIDFVNIPTTLLSMIDASVGGKTGIDMDGIKNGVGIFRNPKQVFIDPVFLKTLPERQLKSGLAEAIKHGILSSREVYDLAIEALKKHETIDEDWIKRIIGIKWDIVNNDPLENDYRKMLNLGHTIGHALESHFLNTEEELLHGEAIALGMIFENDISRRVGLMRHEIAKVIKDDILKYYDFPTIKVEDIDAIIKWIVLDKKNDKKKINLVLARDFGDIERNFEMEEEEFTAMFTAVVMDFVISF